MPQPGIDPWTPELESFLEDLAPEAELVYRLTLQGEYPRLQGRPDCAQRTKALMGEILMTQAAWDWVLDKMRTKDRELFSGTAESGGVRRGPERAASRTRSRKGAH